MLSSEVWGPRDVVITLQDEPELRVERNVRFNTVADILECGYDVTIDRSDGDLSFVATKMATMTMTASMPAMAKLPEIKPADILAQGLCQFIREPLGTASALLSDPNSHRNYSIRHISRIPMATKSVRLSDLIGRDRSQPLFTIERLTLAFVLATSFLQFYTTSWLPDVAQTDNIKVPLGDDGDEVLYKSPYVQAKFETRSASRSNDLAFQEFGITLLELCFSRRLEEHPLWTQSPGMQLPKTHPVARKGIASEWYRQAQYQDGIDYATAVDWCLHKASLKSPDWRVEFAQHVVQPLQKCYEAEGVGTGPRQLRSLEPADCGC